MWVTPGVSAGPREARLTLGTLNLPLLLGGNVLMSCPEWENHPLDCGAREEGFVMCRTNIFEETFEERSCSQHLVYLFTGEIDVLKDMGGRFSRTKMGSSGCSGVIIVFSC